MKKRMTQNGKKGLRNSCTNKNPFLGSTNSGLVSEPNSLTFENE